MFVRVVQIVMARLMRVTFMALHHYLGLSAELMKKVNVAQFLKLFKLNNCFTILLNKKLF